MTTRFDIFLEKWLLRDEVGLCVEDVMAAAADWSLRTLGASAFNREAPLRPKAMLMDYLLHSFEPPGLQVVIWKIK